MVTQPGLHDNDLVLWTQLLGRGPQRRDRSQRLQAEHPHVRYAHGFLIQQLVEGPRPVGEIAENLGVTSQAVSKSVRELEALGYVERWSDPADGRVRRVALTDKGRAVLEAGRARPAPRSTPSWPRRSAPSAPRPRRATLKAALEARGAMARGARAAAPPADHGVKTPGDSRAGGRRPMTEEVWLSISITRCGISSRPRAPTCT